MSEYKQIKAVSDKGTEIQINIPNMDFSKYTDEYVAQLEKLFQSAHHLYPEYGWKGPCMITVPTGKSDLAKEALTYYVGNWDRMFASKREGFVCVYSEGYYHHVGC